EDLRDSPAVDVVHLLLNEGATVQAYDPTSPDGRVPSLHDTYREGPIEAARGADALAVLTNWAEFRAVPLGEVREVMRGRVIFDGRNVLTRAHVEEAGFAYMGVGRNSTRDRRRVTD